MGPQTKAIIWNAIFTFILLVVTGTYAWFTQSMADTMTSQLNLSLEQHRPYIFFEKFEFEPEKFGGLQYMVVVKNSGSVPAKVKLEKFCIDNEDNCSDKLGYLYIFPNSGGSNLGALGDAEEVKESIRENGDIIETKFGLWDNLYVGVRDQTDRYIKVQSKKGKAERDNIRFAR